ncbi:10361_t:CDS:10 [Ambispora leptoticha]|uniref:10361_t:CDS:1 n=1 Tax=Ambispora leptoticha TaxID=144679 RepID=A0A9N8WDE0_9GLOM|nr:10361_t:CDS:10 [Ambispora leptoticha]
MCGFYRSSYTDATGSKKYLATNQFEATDARRAFPCWDEPAIKATFDVTLIVPTELVALSNMNMASEKPLVTFIVGDLAYIEKYTSGEYNDKKPVLVRFYAIKGSEKQGEFALDVATKALDYFARVFKILFPLPKLDMAAIPDFEIGAMENWGLITFRTVAICFDPKASDARYKQHIAYVVAHELAHQWFGNLFTMEWWDHLWLNEGFATCVGYLAIDEIFPEWDIWAQRDDVMFEALIHAKMDVINKKIILHKSEKWKLILVSRKLSSYGWEYPENEDYLTAMLRTLAIKSAGTAGDPEIAKKATRRFKLFTEKNDQSVLHPNIRQAVFEIVLMHGGGEQEFDAILNIFRNGPIVDQKLAALSALGFMQQPKLVQRALDFSISSEVRHQDILYIFRSLQTNRKSRKPLWNFIKKNWDLFQDQYTKSIKLFEYIIKFRTDMFASDETIIDIEKFFADKNIKYFKRPLQQSLENIRTNGAWLKRDIKDVENLLAANGYLKHVS